MKRFFSTVAFCVFLLGFGLLVLLPSATAEKNLLQNLLNLPAAAPPNPFSVAAKKTYAGNYAVSDAPPDDNAPIEELMAYWQSQNYAYRETGYNLQPSEQALRRILSEIGENPDKLPNYLNILPEDSATQEFVKRIYDRQNADGAPAKEDDEEGEQDDRIKNWLTYHSPYFSDELLKIAETVGDTGEYVANQKELLALARVDWEKARPILERLLNDDKQTVSQTLARWAFYQHALKENDSSDIEKYRNLLKATVENKNAKPGNRDLAMDALVESGDFEGRDDWYYTLLEDETLHDLRVNGASYTGLTTLLNRSPRGKYLTKMLELAGSNNPLIRRAAIRNLTILLDSKNPEVIRALLPWLENPEWAPETSGERRRLLSALYSVEMPESVPGLIAVLNEKQSAKIYTPSYSMNSMSYSTNKMTNAMSSAANTSGSMNSVTNMSGSAANATMLNSNAARYYGNTSYSGDTYPYRSEAIGALAQQKDARAIAPLRNILPQIESWQLGSVVRALLASGGFSIPEQVEALETVAKTAGAMPNGYAGSIANVAYNAPLSGTAVNMTVTNDSYTPPPDANDIKPILGQQLAGQYEPDENLITALISRLKILDEKEPATASGLRKIMLHWRGAAINQMLMRDVRDDKADTDTVVKLLSLRKDLRENQWNDINEMRGGSPTAFGIAACLMENSADYDALLQAENADAKTALLACARLIRAALPVQKVAENLKSPNKTLALAAERYLEAEDSPQAQNFVLAAHPNEAKILGARKVFMPDDAAPTISSFLPALFASLENSSGIEYYYYEEYAGDFVSSEEKLRKEVREDQTLLGIYAFDDNFIRVYKDRAVFSWQTDRARFRERDLTKEEYEIFKNYISEQRVGELSPFFTGCESRCEEKELVMLGRNGGRRVYMLGDEPPRFFSRLAALFERMRQPPAKLRYALEKNVAGLEILYEDENLSAETVWKTGADLRVLVSDAARRAQIDKELRQQERADEQKEQVDYEQLWKARQTRRAQRQYENFAWHRLIDGKLDGFADQPAEVQFIKPFDGSDLPPPPKGLWKARAQTFEIRADSEGLYKISGGRATKIAEGYYENPIVTASGKWAVATKYGEEGGAVLTRVNLATRKEFPVKIETESFPRIVPVAYVPSIGKVLVFKGFYSEGENEEEADVSEILTQPGSEFFLLDPETGALQKAKNEVRPLAQQTFRPLQSNGKPDEFWAAIPDPEKEQTEVGVYNAKTLTFKPLLKIPEIEFDSMKMWVDADKIYFVYEGHLLGLPLPK